MRKIILVIVGLILAGGLGFMGGIDYCDSQEPQLITQTQTEYVYPDENKIALLETQLDTCNQSYQHLLELNEELRQQKVREVEVIREVPVEVIKEVGVVREVEVPITLQDFESEKELRDFLYASRDNIVVNLIAGADGEAQLTGYCVALAKSWRDYAALNGKNLEIEDVTDAEYQYWFGRKLDGDGHVILLALVENYKLYLIEPEPLEMHWVGYAP